ncbi:hypothetical protein [Marinifilum sp. D714]|uniref:hypothetical protein n=1 Tax=Marinifilum sp. D714 TaxID=2937523 RepID=UPI0027CD7EF0|nr:hypothetical protein [Marinifilum sp. D714]MDQ2178750.1 hypothetical protein [Marinifilum sp. D714]
MKNYLIIILCSVVLMSCGDDSDTPSGPLLEKYSIEIMDYPQSVYVGKDFAIQLEYSRKHQISKRIGDLIRRSPSTGFNYRTYDKVYDELVYDNDIITITKKLTADSEFTSCLPFKRTLFLENGKLVKKIEDNRHLEAFDNDTTYYYYKNERLEKTTSRDLIRKYVYNESGNLLQISTQNTYTQEKDTTFYLGYDNTPNLCKNLFIFKECFNRSLSTNNYIGYIKKSYDSDGYLVGTVEREWTFQYDDENYVIY